VDRDTYTILLDALQASVDCLRDSVGGSESPVKKSVRSRLDDFVAFSGGLLQAPEDRAVPVGA
jgi:hypothetical protein